MNDLKMGDVFNLQVRVGADQIVRQADGKLIDFFQGGRYAICDAINSYDKNKELIAKLQADNELLREALGEICSGCDTAVSAASIADCALAAKTKG